jgi:hypothetical protein
VAESIQNNPVTSSRKLTDSLARPNLSRTTAQRILDQLGFKPYKFHQHQSLTDSDRRERLVFCTNMLAFVKENPLFAQEIIFSDECLFEVNGAINKQNCRYYSVTNPHAVVQREMHSPKVMVWAAIGGCGKIDPYVFLENVSGETYLDMLQNHFWPRFLALPFSQRLWFMQDGAAPHFSNIVRLWLNRNLGEHWIGRGGTIKWPPRSPDLTPCDFFLWGYIKERVYRPNNMPRDVDDLVDRIQFAFDQISVDLRRTVAMEFVNRLEECVRNNGGHVIND